jgi:ADP-ribose pyrophosphatase
MKRRIEILQQKTIFDRFIFRIEEVHLRHEHFDGSMGAPITRLVLNRGDSVAVLPHDPSVGVVLLCEQFRVPTVERGPGWLAEIPAGMLDKDETVEACAQRETREETDHEVVALTPIATVYPSPGGSSERIHIFYGRIALQPDSSHIAGVAEEGEDIRILRLPIEDALARLRAGEIQDAKTVIALQWLELATVRQEISGSPTPR